MSDKELSDLVGLSLYIMNQAKMMYGMDEHVRNTGTAFLNMLQDEKILSYVNKKRKSRGMSPISIELYQQPKQSGQEHEVVPKTKKEFVTNNKVIAVIMLYFGHTFQKMIPNTPFASFVFDVTGEIDPYELMAKFENQTLLVEPYKFMYHYRFVSSLFRDKRIS
jgi:hypothetical protein